MTDKLSVAIAAGGTAGHVTPNLALLPSLQERGYEIHYIGSYNGIEKKLIENAGIPYDGISSGKLRRYFDIKNFSDPFRVIKGYAEARSLLKKYRPDVVFSKGGFVAVPVVLAARHFKIPTIIHESDMTPGLANKICIPSAAKVCCNFPETLQYLPEDKAVLTGSPIRRELLQGDRLTVLYYTGLSAAKPIIMVIGGSLGAVAVNNAVRALLPKLLTKYQVIHICGKGNLDESLIGTEGYVQYEYIKQELADLAEAILSGGDIRSNPELEKHADWVDEFLPKYEHITSENINEILQKEVGLVFEQVLEDAGVYKCTPEGREAFARFLRSVGFR